MYEAFYGLKSKPFQLNPDPSFYFGSKQHRRAMAYLEYGMHQNEGFIVITGEIGAGKTTIVRGLLESLDPKKVVAAQLVSTQLDAEDTLRLVGAAFGLRTKDVAKSDILMTLEAFLTDQVCKGKRCLLIVDEAQNLTPRAVEELRMLSNFQFGSHAILQSFLIGQPEFRQILQSPHMQQLRQRVIAACHIGPLDKEDTHAYIEHRLKCAGASGQPVFSKDAYAVIHEIAGGVPRRINTICDRLLLLGFLGVKKPLTGDDAKEVGRELFEETGMMPGQSAPVQVGERELNRFVGKVTGEIDLSRMELDVLLADQMSESLKGTQGDHFSQRLQRLEQSMLRLERMNSTTLQLLQQLINAVRKTEPQKK